MANILKPNSCELAAHGRVIHLDQESQGQSIHDEIHAMTGAQEALCDDNKQHDKGENCAWDQEKYNLEG